MPFMAGLVCDPWQMVAGVTLTRHDDECENHSAAHFPTECPMSISQSKCQHKEDKRLHCNSDPVTGKADLDLLTGRMSNKICSASCDIPTQLLAREQVAKPIGAHACFKACTQGHNGGGGGGGGAFIPAVVSWSPTKAARQVSRNRSARPCMMASTSSASGPLRAVVLER